MGVAQNCTALFSQSTSGLTTSFYDHSNGVTSNTHYLWKFGDGDSSNLKEPTHIYTTSGVYQVCLTISDTINCSSIICDSVIVSNFSSNCQAEYAYTIHQNNAVTFNNQTAPLSNYSYHWSFGDSSFSSQMNPIHTYKKPGKYAVKLRSFIRGIASCSVSDTLYVNYCDASFEYQKIDRDSVLFEGKIEASSSNFIHWDFGDGTYSNNTLTSSHKYAQAGLYVVTFSVYDSISNTSCSYKDSIRIKPPSVCQNGFAFVLNDSNLHVFNTALNYTSLYYTFGNGDSSQLENPIYTYQKNGTYTVCQTIFNVNTNCSKTLCDTITVNVPKACIGGFTMRLETDTLKVVNTAKSFTSIEYGLSNGTHYAVPNFNQVQNVEGPLEVCQYLKNNVSFCRDTLCQSITIQLPPECEAGFDFNVTETKVQFVNKANYFDRITYYFGDGDSSLLSNPIHQYKDGGNYVVLQKVENSMTHCIKYYSDTLQIVKPTPCKANFSLSIYQDSISILDLSNVSQFIRYDFGDGNYSFNRNPQHVYSESGNYRICQTIIDSLSGCENTKCINITITVPQLCNAGFNYKVSEDSLQIVSSASNFSSIEYDFGDGNSADMQNPLHIYSKSGTYIVCQTIFDEKTNCMQSVCETITVIVPPVCKAGYNYSVSGDTVFFESLAENYDRIFYDFGDGNIDSTSNPQYIYPENGLYTVQQTAIGRKGNCISTFTDTIEIDAQRPCVAKYEIAIDTSRRGTLYLINTSTKSIGHEYLWSFGDGTTAKGRTPTHRYNNFGKYEICLSVNDDDLGCSSSYCNTVGLDSNGYLLKSNGFLLRVIDGSFIGLAEEEQLEKPLKIYPNPTRENVNVSFPTDVNFLTYELFSFNGTKIIEGTVNQSNGSIDLLDIQPGVYFLRFRNKELNFVKRVIKR